MNITEIAKKAAAFRAKLETLKTPQSFEWYRYDSLSNIDHIERLLTEPNRDLLSGKPVLDIGCGDGDVSFFLESLGYRVTAVDFPTSNHNGMAGVYKLRQLLGSQIEILELDLDSQCSLPKKEFGLVLILGVIYHLKNPFYLLEACSKCASYLLVSTRVLQYLPGVATSVRDLSLAYLLTETELNEDNSNFWIFTESGFLQMLRRTNWNVLNRRSIGNTEASDPINPQHDERIFCYAQSRYALGNIGLLEGWHEPEGSGWRWTMQRFGLQVQLPTGNADAVLEMQLYVPPELIARFGSVTLQNTTYRESGNHEFLLPVGRQDGGIREVHLELNRAVLPDEQDGRERGIIVYSVSVR